MKSIASRQNPWFKRLRDAIREHSHEIVIEGPKQVADAIASGWKAIAVIERGSAETGIDAHGRMERGQVEHLAFAPEIFDAIAETKTTQGVLGLFDRPRVSLESLLARRDTIIVALDGVQDPGNVGTIVRLAAAFDAAGVVLLPGCADAFGPKAIRASAGAVLSVSIVAATASEIIRARIPLFAARQDTSAVPAPAKNAIVVFGSEGAGVSIEIAQSARPIAVRMSNRIESLNVAAAAAILLSRSFEARNR